MKLNFTKSNDLDLLKKEVEEINGLPTFEEIQKAIDKKFYQVIYLRDNRKIIGGCLWYARDRNNASLYLLFVKENFRNKGYSKKILEHAIKIIDKKGFSDIIAFTNRLNIRSIIAFFKNDFKINSFIFDKNLLMLIRHKEKENYKDLLYQLLLEDDIFIRKMLIEKALLNPVPILDIVRKTDLFIFNETDMSSLNKLKYLRYLAESNHSEGVKALDRLSRSLEEISNVNSVVDKLKLLKYVAIHGEKKFSESAINKLYENIDEISNIKNPELQGSLLRYIVMHSKGKMHEDSMFYLKKLKDKKVKDTSLDYLRIYSKNANQ